MPAVAQFTIHPCYQQRRPAVLLATRLLMVLAAAAIATGVSLAVTATVFDAHQWGVYILANSLLATTYALIGS